MMRRRDVRRIAARKERKGEGMFKDGLLRGRRILVTGGGTGLGKGMAEKFRAGSAAWRNCKILRPS